MNNEVLYYYLRDENNHPYGCVAIQESASEKGKINRGVSLCSKYDIFDKKHARGLALSRLNLACSSLFGEPFDEYHGSKPAIPVAHQFNKYDCNVDPTPFEARMLDNHEEVQQ